MIYIYLLRCPISKKVRYVGSSKNPKTRFKQHLKDAEKNRTKKQKWILELKNKCEIPIMEIVNKIDDEILALKLEEETMLLFIEDVYNIHMPDKNNGYVEHFRITGIKAKGSQKLIKKK
jgi:predicted GIY-YIG superfamily endonuclease